MKNWKENHFALLTFCKPYQRAPAEHLHTLPLSTVLEALEAIADPHDPAKSRTAWGVLSVSRPKFINWNLDMGSGGTIDLVMHVRQVGFGQALQRLELYFGTFTPLPPRQRPRLNPCLCPRSRRTTGHAFSVT